MNRNKWFPLPILLAIGNQTIAVDDAHIVAQAVPAQNSTDIESPFSDYQTLSFPTDVDFKLEPLYPAQNNQSKAKIDILYSCVDSETGQRLADCYIAIDPPVVRENSGGHYAGHLPDRPAGHRVPSAGWVNQTDGYLHSTYYASEIGGVVDVAIHCTALIVPCRGRTVVFGVGVQGLEELGGGIGYILTGAKAPHPSNHWGEPNFVSALRAIGATYHETFPDAPDLKFNDISLEYGGVFDIETPTEPGYDWTPPHREHRVGRNIDLNFPVGYERRALVRRLFAMYNIRIGFVHVDHWHLRY